MAKVQMELESITGEPYKPGELNRVELAVDDQRWALYLTEANKSKLLKVLEPFIKNEEANDPDEFGIPAKPKQPRTGAKTDGLTPETRMAIRRWQHMTGRTQEIITRGRIAGADLKAWEAAKKPMPTVEEYQEWLDAGAKKMDDQLAA